MTKLLFDPKAFDSFFVGMDSFLDRALKLQDEIGSIPNFPPFNVRKVDDNHYVVEMAVAGFGHNDIDITMDGDKLIIKGEVKSDGEPADLGKFGEYIHRGIAMRSFNRSFKLIDHLEVENAEMFNGMLKIWLERNIPEEKKPKKIPVKASPGKQLLTE